ncbi:dihydrofolate reductase, partial [Nannochloropsis gaditana]
MLLRRCLQHCLDTSAPNGIKRVDIRRYTALDTQFPPSTSFTASSSCSSSLASSSSSSSSFSFFLPSTSPPPSSPCPSFSSSSTSFSSSSSFTKLSSISMSRGLQPPLCRRFSHLPRPFSPDMRGKRDDVRMIACVAPPNLTIGKGGQLPWDLPEDRQYFFHCTRGHILVLGRRSYEVTIPVPVESDNKGEGGVGGWDGASGGREEKGGRREEEGGREGGREGGW